MSVCLSIFKSSNCVWHVNTYIYFSILYIYIPIYATIDLVDEAAAKLNIEVTSKPQEVDELDRKLIQLQMGKTLVHIDTYIHTRMYD